MEFIQVVLRALQFLWTLLITALIGNVIQDAFNGNPASINYAMFVAVFSWLVLIYGVVAAVMEGVNIPVLLMAGDALAALFTFIAGITLAAELNVHSCSNAVSYDDYKLFQRIKKLSLSRLLMTLLELHTYQPYDKWWHQLQRAMSRTSS